MTVAFHATVARLPYRTPIATLRQTNDAIKCWSTDRFVAWWPKLSSP